MDEPGGDGAGPVEPRRARRGEFGSRGEGGPDVHGQSGDARPNADGDELDLLPRRGVAVPLLMGLVEHLF